MNLLNQLTIKNLKLNRKRTVVTIVGIMLSIALITAVASIYSGMVNSLITFEKTRKGNFHVAYYNVSKEDLNTFKNNRKVKNIYLTQDVGYAKLEESKNEYKPYAFVKSFTKDALEELSLRLVEGRMPEKADEIVIPTHLKTNGRIELEVGDSITLDVGERYSEGSKLTQSNPFTAEVPETIENAVSKTYKIVGIVERPAYNLEAYEAPGYTFVTIADEKDMQGNVDVFAEYTKEGRKDYLNVTANLLEIDEDIFAAGLSSDGATEEEMEAFSKEMKKAKYEVQINHYLIMMQNNPLDEQAVGGLASAVVVVCIIIVVTSVFCIKNSFDISITEKTKQYGMLRSVGATKKQIRKNVFYEATVLGAIGIPLGLLLGMVASFLLVKISNYFLRESMVDGYFLEFSISYMAMAIAVGLGIVTIYFSSVWSARRAAKVSPIESICNSADIKLKGKKVKSPKWIRKIFGVGGEISYKNLKRNRKKYRTTVLSITLSAIIFIALSAFMNMAFQEVKQEIALVDYNIVLSVYGNEEATDSALECTQLENVKNYSVYRGSNANIVDPKYYQEYRDFWEEEDGENSGLFEGNVILAAVGEKQYQSYVKKLGLNYDKIKDQGILISSKKIVVHNEKKDQDEGKMVPEFDYKKGDTIKLSMEENRELSIPVALLTNECPMGIELYEYSPSYLLVSDEMYEQYASQKGISEIFIDSDNADKLQDDIDVVLSAYEHSTTNIEENARMMRNAYILIGIFLYGFIIVISLIGITNIFNTITTNMELRKREFAMLKSIGMTTKEFKHMIRLETLFMGTKALIFGIPVGIALSLLMGRRLEYSENLIQVIPVLAIFITIVAVFLLITCIMHYSIGKINKQNIIETIRNENI